MAGENDDIDRYRKGLMGPAERHALEKKALHDPFLADALEGAESVSPEAFSADVQSLTKKIRGGKTGAWYTPLRIAAGVVLLLGAGSLFYYFNSTQPETLALKKDMAPASAADSIAGLRDSSSTLLSLAQPAEETKKSPARSSSGPNKADQKSPAGETKSSGDASVATQTETQPQPTPLAKTEAEPEKSKRELAEISEEKKEVVVPQPQTLASGSVGGNRKASQASRDEKSKDDAGFVQLDQAYQNIAGRVTSENGEAIAGVNVVVKGSTTGTVTDGEGNYQLSTHAANPKLVFSYIGMHSVEATPANKSSLDIQLKEDPTQLSEVVVTGLSAKNDNDADREPIVKMAAPVGGIKAYNKYLENNLRYPQQALENKVKGKVTIQFTVTTDGSLTEFNVLKGLGHGCDDEVIRLVKEGPKWFPTTQDDVPVESEVKVKMKFDPAKATR